MELLLKPIDWRKFFTTKENTKKPFEFLLPPTILSQITLNVLYIQSTKRQAKKKKRAAGWSPLLLYSLWQSEFEWKHSPGPFLTGPNCTISDSIAQRNQVCVVLFYFALRPKHTHSHTDVIMKWELYVYLVTARVKTLNKSRDVRSSKVPVNKAKWSVK